MDLLAWMHAIELMIRTGGYGYLYIGIATSKRGGRCEEGGGVNYLASNFFNLNDCMDVAIPM